MSNFLRKRTFASTNCAVQQCCIQTGWKPVGTAVLETAAVNRFPTVDEPFSNRFQTVLSSGGGSKLPSFRLVVFLFVFRFGRAKLPGFCFFGNLSKSNQIYSRPALTAP